MKKLLSLFLALALLLGIVPALGEALPAETPDAGIPAVGDVIEGFEVREVREFSLIGAQLGNRREAAVYRQRRYQPRLPAVLPDPPVQ